MEFFILRTGEVKEVRIKNCEWTDHCFGITDNRGHDFLDSLEDKVNGEVRDELMSLAQTAGKYSAWLENKDLPFEVIDVNDKSMLVCRKMSYYRTYDGQEIFKGGELKERIVKAVTEVLNRHETVDENELKCAVWFLGKMGINVAEGN